VTVLSPVPRLLAHIVDYAGTFPPASLAVDDALSAYACERCGPDAWLLGRLVLPAQSFDTVEDATWSASPGEWLLSAIAGPDARAALARVNAFNGRWAGRARIASVEFAPAAPADIAGLMRLAGDRTEAFFETPIDADLQARLDAISAAGGAAKVRTGGTTPAAIPSPAALADFLFECAERGLSFKATAGLHHAVRSCYPLTYERDSSTAVMHGFLNALAAAAIARTGASRADLVEALVEPSITVLMETARLHDPDATRLFFRSFGSCSFREPADELARMNLEPT
jgi:hypothetical protein